MGAANVKRQLAINEYPNVIVTGEEELDAGFFLFPIFFNNSIGKRIFYNLVA